MINYHSHLHGCMHNNSIRSICIACKFDAWQMQSRKPSSVVGKDFEKQLTLQDKELLHDLLISLLRRDNPWLFLGKLIADRAKRDPAFKRQTLKALYSKLAEAKPKTEAWQKLSRAIALLEKMK